MRRKHKQLIIAAAVIGLLAAAVPALEAVAGDTTSPFGKVDPLGSMQEQIDALKSQLRDLLSPRSPRNLEGDYAVLGNLDCMYDTPAFGPHLQLIVGPGGGAAVQHNTFVGTTHYNGDGTGTETIQGMTVLDQTSNNAFPISTFTVVSCPLTYVVNADGTFVETRAAGCTSNVSGGSTTTFNSSVQLQGRISNRGKMLFIAGITPAAEQVVNTVSGPHERVCTRNVVATKIK